MGPLTETTYVPLLTNLVLWIKVLEVCAVILFILALVTVIIARMRRRSLRMRASALIPLAAGIATSIAVYVLHTTYAYWNQELIGAYTIFPGAQVIPTIRSFILSTSSSASPA